MFKKIVFLLVTIACWAVAENFLAPEKQLRVSGRQIQDEIIELMAQLIEQKSTLVEKEAQVQQMLCKKVRAYAQHDTKNFLRKTSLKELRAFAAKLEEEKRRSERYGVHLSKVLTMLSSA
jgi:hypothetical protein